MSDEQTIYISPEDELTAVRERLEQIPARHLTMVISPQTQLRSHVAWKLLYARARELGKEVVIVSSDPQVRSVAHAVKFKVAHSLESSPAAIGRSRPPSRSGHTSGSGAARTRTSSHLPSTKATNEPRSIRNQRGTSTMGTTPPTHTPEAERHADPQDRQPTEDTTVTEISPQTFDAPEQAPSQPYDFHIDTPPAIHPLTDEIEEPDLLLEDYTQAQDIRSAAREGQKHFPETDIAPETRPEKELPPSSTTPQPLIADDLFTYIEEDPQPPHTDESAVISLTGAGIHHKIEDIKDVSDNIIDSTIEYRGDRDEIVPPASSKPVTYRETEQAIDDDEQDNFPSRTYGVRSRRRSSKLPLLPQTPLTAFTRRFEEDALPPVEERHSKPRSSVPLQLRTPSASSPGKLSPDREARIPRTNIARGQQAQPKSPPRPVQPRLRSGSTHTGATIRQYAALGINYRKACAAVAIAILLLLVTYLLLYFGPTAKIIVGIATQDYSKQITFTAKTDNQIPDLKAQQFSKVFLKSGIGTATGNQLVGTNSAQGSVIFTDTGSNPNGIVIPSGSIITTNGDNAIQFATTTEVLVLPSNQNRVPPPVSIQAVKPGNDGNVDAGVITAIPNSTLNSIAQAQIPPIAVSDVNLTVANNAATTGGGAKPTPVVTNQDLSTTQNNLSQQLQSQIQAWQQHLPSTGAVGTPQTTSTLTNAPQVNDIAANGTFSATIKVTATVLFVPTTDLQKAAIQQLNDAIKNDKSHAGDTILSNSNPTVTITQLKQITADANSITFSFNATAKTGSRLITKEYVQSIVKGKSITDTKSALIRIPGVKTVDITISPNFLQWVPSWTGHIDVTIYPVIKAASH